MLSYLFISYFIVSYPKFFMFYAILLFFPRHDSTQSNRCLLHLGQIKTAQHSAKKTIRHITLRDQIQLLPLPPPLTLPLSLSLPLSLTPSLPVLLTLSSPLLLQLSPPLSLYSPSSLALPARSEADNFSSLVIFPSAVSI